MYWTFNGGSLEEERLAYGWDGGAELKGVLYVEDAT